MDVGILNEAIVSALTVHTPVCIGEFCGVAGTNVGTWVRCRGFGNAAEDEKTFLVNLQLLTVTPDCPCKSGEVWLGRLSRVANGYR